VLAGHIAVGFFGKRIAPEISLGTLVLASLAADLIWCLLLIAGVEHIAIQPGRTTQDSLVATNIAISHSLVMDGVWAALLAAGLPFRRSTRAAGLLFAVVLSHWFLDVVSHRPDMPLAPGLEPRFGLGLWDSVPATLAIEGGFWLLAVVLYARVTKSRNRTGTYSFWAGVIVLTAIWWNNFAGPPPRSDVRTLGISSFIFFSLVVIWAYWMDRLRLGLHGSNSSIRSISSGRI